MVVPSIFQSAVSDKQLMISVSGIRAILPTGLDPVGFARIAMAFADTTGPTIVLGRDSRPTGEPIVRLFRSILELCGKTIIDTGIAPTPTVKAVVSVHKASGGVIVTASHNPEEWNGLKFLGSGGFFYDQSAIEALMQEVDHPTTHIQKSGMGTKVGKTEEIDGTALHIESILNIIPNLKDIRKKKYRVVVDAVSGAGREAMPRLLAEMGCSVIPLFCEPANHFPRPPEPTPSALKEFGKLVQRDKAAVGFALDPDADRLVTGSMAHGAIHEEYTLPLAFLGKRRTLKRSGTLVVNLSTSTLLDSVAGRNRVERSAVGEANVVGQMLSRRAIFGGEGNGGVIDPSLPSFGRDSLAGAAWILSAMAAGDVRGLDDLLSEIPPLFMSKDKLEKKGDIEESFTRYESIARSSGRLQQSDRRDGLHLLFTDGAWVHLRASNTEPILRLIAQASDRQTLEDLQKAFH